MKRHKSGAKQAHEPRGSHLGKASQSKESLSLRKEGAPKMGPEHTQGMHKAAHTKIAANPKQGGGNLKFPAPSQAIHIEQKSGKDLAGNVGGNAHMQAGDDRGPAQNVYESGGGKKGVKKSEY